MGAIVMGKPVDGVNIVDLKQIKDERGMVMHHIRADASHFKGFGESYISQVLRGAIKAWKLHKRMWQSFAVPLGKIKICVFDDRENSATRGNTCEIIAGRDNYSLIQIPPLVWYGFACHDCDEALIVNAASIGHEPEESLRADLGDARFPKVWKVNE